jgi:pyrroloquinoline-quinone synthase
MHDNTAARAKLFSSSDFCRVPDRPGVELPPKLIDRSGARGAGAGSDAFSGERRHPVQVVDLPSFSLSMTIGRLVGRQASRRHRHNYETILYICEGRGITVIEDRVIEWEAGDAVYIPVWAWHHHENRSADSDCLYVACENAPLLQNLGQIALREEQP